MNDLIKETNSTLEESIVNLFSAKTENEHKLADISQEVENQLQKVKGYKEAFNKAKDKIAQMNEDIVNFESDYQNLVDKFQNDELQNILVSANKEITLKIDDRKKKIKDEQIEMNKLVQQASISKQKLLKLTAEKKAIELKLEGILDAYEFYNKTLSEIIDFSTKHPNNLRSYFGNTNIEEEKEVIKEKTEEVKEEKKDFKKDKKEVKKIEIIDKSEEPEEVKEETTEEDFFNFDDSIPE